MLSRVANSLYWMARYLERAENAARFLTVTHTYAQETRAISHEAADQCWAVTRTLLAGEDDAEEYRAVTFRRLAYDESLANSVLSCLARCRENARGIRDAISSEMWEELNILYLFLSQEAGSTHSEASQLSMLQRCRTAAHVFQGLRDNTICRSDEWHFLNLGQFLERAEMTTRILYTMYTHPALITAAEAGHSIDVLHLATTLRSCTALEAFSRAGQVLTPERVAEFLLLDNYFPRSVEFCVQRVVVSLHALSNTPLDVFANEAEQLSGRLVAELRFAGMDDLMQGGLPQYLNATMGKVADLSRAVREEYFR